MKFRLTVIVLVSLLFASVSFNALHIQALERAEQQKEFDTKYHRMIVNNLMDRVYQIEN